jgi:hypothetical protein
VSDFSKNVTLKVSGKKEAVERFVAELEEVFVLMLRSKLLRNDCDNNVHCFIDLDPFTLRAKEVVEIAAERVNEVNRVNRVNGKTVLGKAL